MAQTQTPSVKLMDLAANIPYVASSPVYTGDVILVGNLPLIAVHEFDQPSPDADTSTIGALAAEGIFNVPKDNSVFAAGDLVFWNPSGNPNLGTSGTGAATGAATSYCLGRAVQAQLTGDNFVMVKLLMSGQSSADDAIGGSTAAAGTTTTDAAVLPAATAKVYPTTGASGTNGVRVNAADKVTGRRLFIGNSAAAILKVYPPTGGNINGLGVDAAFSTVSQKGCILICTSSGSNTWIGI